MRTPFQRTHIRRPGSCNTEYPWKHRAPSVLSISRNTRDAAQARTPHTSATTLSTLPRPAQDRDACTCCQSSRCSAACGRESRGHVGRRLSDKAVNLERAPVVPAHNQRYDTPVVTPPCDDVHVAFFVQCDRRAPFALRGRCVRTARFPARPSCSLFHAHLLSWVLRRHTAHALCST